jgi:GNAT superfamily N-acetyltransferase
MTEARPATPVIPSRRPTLSASPLARESFDAAAALLADAFFTNPAHVYICPDPARRREQLARLLGGNLRIQPDLSQSFSLWDGREIAAMGFWTRSDAPPASAWSWLRAGVLAAPLHLGASGVRRLFETRSAVERAVAKVLGSRSFWYLNNLAVRRELRGSGIGTRLLRDQLAIVRALEPDFEIALSTQRPENVAFYRRFGFEVASEERVGSGPHAFLDWTLVVRDPARGTRRPELG